MGSCAGATKGSLTAPTAKEMAMFRSFQYLVQRFKFGISVCCGCASAMIHCLLDLPPAQKYLFGNNVLLRLPSVRASLHLANMRYPKSFRKRVRHGNSNCQSINKGKPKDIGTLFFVASLSSIWFP